MELRDQYATTEDGVGFVFGDIGEVVLKGFEEPVRLHEVRRREEI